MKKIVERFLIGGSSIGPSMPSARLQRAIGREIEIDILSQTLLVPTSTGRVRASKGDRIICYDDGSYEVEREVE